MDVNTDMVIGKVLWVSDQLLSRALRRSLSAPARGCPAFSGIPEVLFGFYRVSPINLSNLNGIVYCVNFIGSVSVLLRLIGKHDRIRTAPPESPESWATPRRSQNQATFKALLKQFVHRQHLADYHIGFDIHADLPQGFKFPTRQSPWADGTPECRTSARRRRYRSGCCSGTCSLPLTLTIVFFCLFAFRFVHVLPPLLQHDKFLSA